jgi:hypothetical protein
VTSPPRPKSKAIMSIHTESSDFQSKNGDARPPVDRNGKAPAPFPLDFLTLTELEPAGLCLTDLPQTYLVGLDGRPCWEYASLLDFGLVKLEGGRPL